MASWPVRSEATTVRSVAASIHRDTSPRTTIASSTTMTRIGSCPAMDSEGVAVATAVIERGTRVTRKNATGGWTRRSDQTDFLELGFDDLLVERLHDVFVGARVQRARDMRHVVFGGAEDDLGAVA